MDALEMCQQVKRFRSKLTIARLQISISRKITANNHVKNNLYPPQESQAAVAPGAGSSRFSCTTRAEGAELGDSSCTARRAPLSLPSTVRRERRRLELNRPMSGHWRLTQTASPFLLAHTATGGETNERACNGIYTPPPPRRQKKNINGPASTETVSSSSRPQSLTRDENRSAPRQRPLNGAAMFQCVTARRRGIACTVVLFPYVCIPSPSQCIDLGFRRCCRRILHEFLQCILS
ncbi:uncharacterized protein [Chiloscyllium punctatum]|uniref:uncharacterized protein n=1 Tax=Chiloscyllium punctatum TaxID=137246 RepID=UPI003B6333D9